MSAALRSRNDQLVVLAACALAAFSTMGAALPYPVLPPLFAAGPPNGLNAFLGLPPKLLYSVAVATYPMGLLGGTVVLGPLSDRYGRRRILLVSTWIGAFGHLASAWTLAIGNYPLFLLARLATGSAEGNASVARALLADTLQGDARTRAFASFNGALYSGWLVGPLLAGILVPFGVTVPFYAAACLLLATVAVAAFAFADTPGSHATGSLWQTIAGRHSLALLSDRALRRIFMIHLGYTFGATAFYEFYPLWLVEFAHMGTQGIAVMTALLCTAMTGTSIWLGRGHGPAPRPHYLRFYAALTAVAVIGTVALGPRLGLLALVLFGVPNALYNSVLPVYAAERFGHLGYGSLMGLISTTFSISNIVTAIVGGAVTLVDTRLILVLGGVAMGWTAWAIGVAVRAPPQALQLATSPLED